MCGWHYVIIYTFSLRFILPILDLFALAGSVFGFNPHLSVYQWLMNHWTDAALPAISSAACSLKNSLPLRNYTNLTCKFDLLT